VLPASVALAQVPSASRLDEVIKSGKLRVCTPGAMKPPCDATDHEQA